MRIQGRRAQEWSRRRRGLHEWPENAIEEQAMSGIHLAHKLFTHIRIAGAMKLCRIGAPCQEADYSVHTYAAAKPGPAKSSRTRFGNPKGQVAWRNRSERARLLERCGTRFSSSTIGLDLGSAVTYALPGTPFGARRVGRKGRIRYGVSTVITPGQGAAPSPRDGT